MRLSLVLVFLFASQTVHAATITVDSLLDNTDVDGSCTLREAINAASSNTATDCTAGETTLDTITFADGLNGTLGVTQGTEFLLSGPTAIQGPGSDLIIVDALRLTRVFHVTQQSGEALLIEGLTIRNGNTSGDGGGLLVDGGTDTLTLRDVVFDGNFAGGSGGGLALAGPQSAALSISDSAFTHNEADVAGGALYAGPAGGSLSISLAIERTRVVENITLLEVPNVVVHCDAAPCDFVIDAVESADNEGFHMDLRAEAPSGDNTLIVSNSLFLGETDLSFASEHGGLLLTTFQGELKVYNNSFMENKADDFGALLVSTGDPTWPALVAFNSFLFNVDRTQFFTRSVRAKDAAVRIYANLFGGGQCTVDDEGDGSISSLGWNYVAQGDAETCNLSSDDQTVESAGFLLDPIVYGNEPAALVIRAGRPSIDAVPDCTLPSLGVGDSAMALTRDQGGNARPQRSVRENHCDAGAVEFGPTLSIFEMGTGGGSIGTDPSTFAGFSAGDEEDGGGIYFPGTKVTLTPFPDQDSLFLGFSGACEGVDPCTLVMDEPKVVDVLFELAGAIARLDVQLGGTGTGRVSSTPAGIDCPGTCTAFFDSDSNVTLTFSTGPGSDFAGWSGDCTGLGICALTMDEDKSATAEFDNPDVIFKNGLELPVLP